MFFEPFQVLYLVEKQAYKLELLAKQRIHDIFYILMLEQNIIRKGQVNKVNKLLKLKPEFYKKNNKEYQLGATYNSRVYVKEATSQLPGLFYLVSYKNHSKDENTWEFALAVVYL